jgi:hypothetical protein
MPTQRPDLFQKATLSNGAVADSWPKSGRILRERLPNTRVTQLEKAGHFLMLDAPDRYLKAPPGSYADIRKARPETEPTRGLLSG